MSLLTDLKLWCKLDETSGNALDSHGVNTLSDNNSVGSASGKVGNCRTFNGSNQKFTIADNTDLSVGDVDWTASAWVYWTADVISVVIGKWQSSGNQLSFVLGVNSSDDRVFFGISSDGASVSDFRSDNTFGPLSLNTWYFIVWWHDSVADTINIQINNSTVSTFSYIYGTFDSTADFCIGADSNGAFHTGNIDEVGFWKRVLTSDERTFLYNGGNGVTYSNLVPSTPEPIILFNSYTGPILRASGSSADMTNGDTFIDLSTDSPNLMNIPQDGTASITVDTTSGIMTFIIASASNVTKKVVITTSVPLTNSGRSWYIMIVGPIQKYLLLFRP